MFFGLLVGVFALFLATHLKVQHALPSFSESLAAQFATFSLPGLELPDFSHLHLPGLPAGVDSYLHILQQHFNLQQLPAINFSFSAPFSSESSDPSQLAVTKGYRAHHPLFIIPGFTTTGMHTYWSVFHILIAAYHN